MDDNISFNMGEQISIIGEKEKHRLDIGDLETGRSKKNLLLNVNPNSNSNSNADWGNLLQQTRNISQIATPENKGKES